MSLARVAAVSGALLAAAVALLAWGAQLVAATGGAVTEMRHHPSPDTAERLLVGVAGVGISAAGVWLVAVTLVCLLDLATGRVRCGSGPWRPRLLRAVVLGTCVPAVGALLCTGGPVAADTTDDRPGRRVATGLAASLSGLPLPERPVEPSGQVEPPRAGARRTARTHVVRRGECLWTIAADIVGAGATSPVVDHAWRALYRVNRRRIGDDPGLIRPAQRLLVPASLLSSR